MCGALEDYLYAFNIRHISEVHNHKLLSILGDFKIMSSFFEKENMKGLTCVCIHIPFLKAL